MSTRLFLTITISLTLIMVKAQPFVYPLAKKDTITTNYFGTKVSDPYRWMEDPSSDERREWVAEENKLTKDYLSKLENKYLIFNQIKDKRYVDFGSIIKSGKFYFDRWFDEISNSVILYIKSNYKDDESAQGIVFTADYKKDKNDVVNIEDFEVSKDNKHFAFELSHRGSDWREIHVKSINFLNRFKDEGDVLKWVKFSNIAWAGDGFYYCRYPEESVANELTGELLNQAIYYHKLGQQQSEDKLIFNDPTNPKETFDFDIVGDGRYLIIYSKKVIKNKTFNLVSCATLNNPEDAKPELLMASPYSYSIVEVYKNRLLAKTNENAPNGKLVFLDIDAPNQSEEFIKQYEDILKKASVVGDKIVCTYLTDIDWSCLTFDSLGVAINKIKFPIGTSIGGFDCSRTNKTLFNYESFLYPPIAYEYDVDKLKVKPFQVTETPTDFFNYVTKKVFYKSKDGTEIPMIISYKEGKKIDENTPTLLYGYGGYGISLTPSYNYGFVNFLENGGILAIPSLRGGGEYGDAWHNMGKLANKQNVFDDFIAAAQYLIDNKYTRKEKLAIMGGSNGGLLVGAVITQRPDLCSAAIANVGVYDMLRYHLFTIGHEWEDEYGTSKDSTQFSFLYKYSPLQNVKPDTEYPATLIITGDHDDRVVPMHSYKFAATLQDKNKGKSPILLVTGKNSGHNVGSVQMEAYIYSFIYEQLGIKAVSVKNNYGD